MLTAQNVSLLQRLGKLCVERGHPYCRRPSELMSVSAPAASCVHPELRAAATVLSNAFIR